MNIQALRGAVSIEEDNGDSIKKEVQKLIDELIKKNKLKHKNIVSIQFTQTPDLVSLNAAAALRNDDNNYKDIPLFVSQEPVMDNSLPRIIRVLILYRSFLKKKLSPLYLGKAKKLRPDIQ